MSTVKALCFRPYLRMSLEYRTQRKRITQYEGVDDDMVSARSTRAHLLRSTYGIRMVDSKHERSRWLRRSELQCLTCDGYGSILELAHSNTEEDYVRKTLCPNCNETGVPPVPARELGLRRFNIDAPF